VIVMAFAVSALCLKAVIVRTCLLTTRILYIYIYIYIYMCVCVFLSARSCLRSDYSTVLAQLLPQ